MSRAERFIQIKWRLCNFDESHLSFPDVLPADFKRPEILRPKSRKDWDPSWKWQPDLPDDMLVVKLKWFLEAVRETFRQFRTAIQFFPEMKPYLRTSFLNWDWCIMRGLHMFCPGCGHEKGQVDTSDQCLVKRFGWALKPLATGKNRAQHVAWWFFLMYYLQNSTLYDILPYPEFKWRPKLSDEALNEFPKVSQEITRNQLAITMNPDLVPLRLRSYEPSCHPLSPPESPDPSSKPSKKRHRSRLSQ